MSQFHRREFLVALAGALASVPRLSRAAEEPVRRIGLLGSSSPAATAHMQKAIIEALAARGWVEGRNLVVDRRYANGMLERHDALAQELIALRPDVIVAPTQPAALAAMKATRSIPIVFVIVPDPVASGLVASLARPRGNATGVATVNAELIPKRLAILREAFPRAKRIALIYQASFDLSAEQAKAAEDAGRALGLELRRIEIGGPETFDGAFAALDAAHPDAVLVIESPPVFTYRRDVVARIGKRRLPAMYGLQEFVRDGGLMSYSMSFVEQFRRAGEYVDRILRGAKPGDLPVEQPSTFQLLVNLRAARGLEPAMSQALLLRADEVIE